MKQKKGGSTMERGNMKKALSTICLCAIVFIFTSRAPYDVYAASSGNVTVTVTIENVSVSLSGTSWDIGTIAAGQTVQMSEASDITVTNNGNVTESFTLMLSNPPGWTAGSNAGADVYVMKGLFVGATDAPAPTDFGANDVITTTSQTASPTVFGAFSSTGNSVPASSSADLWLQFTAPTSTTVVTSQSIVITIGATVP